MTQLATRSFQLSINGVRHNVFRATPEPNTPLDAIEAEKYWAHVSHLLRPGSIIEVIPDDYSFFAKLLVIDAGKLYAKVRRLSFVDFTAKAVTALPEGYEVKHRGPRGWSVVRGKDVMVENLSDKDTAVAWLDEHLAKAA